MNKRLVLKNLKKVNDEKLIDIIIEQGKIVDIKDPGTSTGELIYDFNGRYVSSGWIDLHVHAFPEFKPYGDKIDEVGIKQGVTTIVDAGSCGANRIQELHEYSKTSLTKAYAFLNVSKIGLERVDELSNINWLNERAVLHAVDKYSEFIVGLKARLSASVVGDNGVNPLHIARKMSNSVNRPLMVHIGTAPPRIETILPLLKKHDIVTHFLNGKPNKLFDYNKKPLSVFTDAINRGVHFDVGHGSSSFSFEMAEIAKKNNIKFDTISTDIYKKNRLEGPVYNMAHVLSKFLVLGYSLEEVINSVTEKPAEWLNKPELGRIQIGDSANLTIFSIKNHTVQFEDSMGIRRKGTKEIMAEEVMVDGKLIRC